MNIYTDGRLDYEKTRNELTALPAVSNAAARKENAQLITTATLLDIAMSLRDVAVLLSPTYTIDTGMTPVEDPDPYIDPEEAYRVTSATPAGTRVKHGLASGRLTGDYGYTEDTDWAEVVFDAPEGREAGRARVWADELVIVPEEAPTNIGELIESGEDPAGYELNESAPFINAAAEAAYMETVNSIAELAASPVPLVGVATEAEAPALLTDEDDDGEPAVGGYDLVDDIDGDFDGDPHTEATDAVAALKARRKAAKKGK